MIDLEIQFDKDKYQDMIARAALFNKDIDKAINRAARRAADTGKAETKRQLAAEYTLPSSEIGKTIEVKPLSEGMEMRIFSSVQDIMEFKGVKPKTPQTSGTESGRVIVEIKNGNSFDIERGFVGYLQKGQKKLGLYQRDAVKNNVLRRYHGPTTVGMFKANETVHNAAIEKIMETLDKRMIHELERLLNG
jgi:hypothetical protein